MLSTVAACAVIVASILIYLGLNAAYRNGVVDGYGYSVEPDNPGYAHAGAVLLRAMAHRWPELHTAIEETHEPHDNAGQSGRTAE